jgi:hypothetical protein
MPMASPPLAPWRCAVFALVVLATTAASATSQPADGSAPENVYPDWAAAVAPAYTSKVTGEGRTTDQFYDVYQINTADPYETVLAWYKARVQTKWPDRHPNQTVGKVGQVSITLQTTESSDDGTRTSIGFIKKR